MSLSLSSRAELTAQAEIRVMSIECEKVGGINLAQGVCDLPVPAAIRAAACSAMRNGVNSYTRYDGLAELRNAISIKLRDHNGIVADPESEIIVSAGSTGAFYCACLSLLEPGESVTYEFQPGRFGWLQVASGSLVVNGMRLDAGDGLAIGDEKSLSIAGDSSAEFLLFDLA